MTAPNYYMERILLDVFIDYKVSPPSTRTIEPVI